MIRHPPRSTLFPYPPLFRSRETRPDIIMLSLSGYGQTGLYSRYVSYGGLRAEQSAVADIAGIQARLSIARQRQHDDIGPRLSRSEERRVGKEGRSRWVPYHLKKKKNKTQLAR